MTCSQIQKLLHAQHDGELDAAHELQVNEHLTDCPHCSGITRNLGTLRGALQNDALRFSAPAGLRRSIRAAVEKSAESEHDAVATPRRSWNWNWSVAATLLAAAVLAFQFRPSPGDDRLLSELTDSHVRSLLADHLTDVTSTDQHTVKPWFTGKLDFAPPVKDLKSVGFPLLGGRLDYFDNRTVAALVYARQKHTINLFIWPASSPVVHAPHATQRNGYHLVQWSDGRMNLVAISDLNEAELLQFATAILP
jgi:anti-sigma factor RsiW